MYTCRHRRKRCGEKSIAAGVLLHSHHLPHSNHLRDEMPAGTMALNQRARKAGARERIASGVFFLPHSSCCRFRDDTSSFHENIYLAQSSADYHNDYCCSCLLTATLLSRNLSLMNFKMVMLGDVPLGFLRQICVVIVRNDLYINMTNMQIRSRLYWSV